MCTITEINTTERRLLAAKHKVKLAQNEKWLSRKTKSEKQLMEAVSQAEQEVVEIRKTLAKIIVDHYKIEL